jgi:hypothetical protein
MALHVLGRLAPALIAIAAIAWWIAERLPKAGLAWIEFLRELRVYRDERRKHCPRDDPS